MRSQTTAITILVYFGFIKENTLSQSVFIKLFLYFLFENLTLHTSFTCIVTVLNKHSSISMQ